MKRPLREASMHVNPGSSVVVPLIIEGLPERIEALGEHWHRKRELHMTTVGAELLERAAQDGASDVWDVAVEVLSGRSIGPITPSEEFRRVSAAEKPGLRTIVVMVDAPGLQPLYAELSDALRRRLEPPPAHVTLYSSDPAEGIGILDGRQLRERAPALGADAQDEIRRAIGW